MATKKTETKKQTAGSPRPVVITTEHRGVFFGYLTDEDVTKDTSGKIVSAKLQRARNCIYWPPANKGFMGLAAMGPVDGARIGPPVTALFQNVTAVLEVENPEAVQRWESAPWT